MNKDKNMRNHEEDKTQKKWTFNTVQIQSASFTRDAPEFVNMAAEIAVLLFNVNNCVFVKEQLVLISL